MVGHGISWSSSAKRLLVPNHLHKSVVNAARLQRRLTGYGRHIYLPSHFCTEYQLSLRRHLIAQRRSTKRLDRLRTMRTASHFERIDHSYVVEEESVFGYNPKHYYPVKLGEILHERYKVITKLGYGSASTVWLCRDLQQQHEYVALKVYINCSKFHREIPIYKEINNLQTTHEGQKYVRKMYDSFQVRGPHGTHECLVHEPLGISLGELKVHCPDELFSPQHIRVFLRYILSGLQFLHKEADIIHTGTLS